MGLLQTRKMVLAFLLPIWCIVTLPVAAADQTCNITTTNSLSYICDSTNYMGDLSMGVHGFDVASTACSEVDTDLSSSSINATVSFTSNTSFVSCADIGVNYVIKCFMFASYGSTTGSCAELSDPAEVCLFKDSGNVVFLDETIGIDCVGKADCSVRITNSGYVYNGITYENTMNDGSGYSWSDLGTAGDLTGAYKMLAVCGAPAASSSSSSSTSGLEAWVILIIVVSAIVVLTGAFFCIGTMQSFDNAKSARVVVPSATAVEVP